MPESIVVGLLTFLLGLILGHRMSLWRERRKEFNEVATPVRVALKSRRNDLRPYWGTSGTIASKDMEVFEHLLGSWKRARFRRAWRTYQEECGRTKQDSYGQSSYQSPEAVAAALDRASLLRASVSCENAA